tara:strand:- start:67 stop:1206 length:1140 start_codon:yes stop_codon:yes gene_type:complete
MAPFKSTLARSVGKLLGVYKEPDLSLRGATQSSRLPPPVAVPFTANIVMMGGGGGGGSYQGGGGGGAGGMAIFTFAVTLDTAYPFQVGNSGLGSPEYPQNGNGGVYSYFNTDSGQKAGAGGAGGKAAAPNTPGTPAAALGGCGGGGGSNPNAVTNGASGDNAAPDPNVFGGTSGGSSTSANAGAGGNTGGGGGGVGGNGGNARAPGSNSADGDGGGEGGIGKEAPAPMFPSAFMKGPNFPSTFIGLPVSLPDASLRTFGGGGGGGAEFGHPGEGYGGPGGGGNGANVNRQDISATAGVHGRGAGGGGGGQVIDNPNVGKEGGGGVIYIQYPENVSATISVPGPRGPLANNYTTNTGDANNYVIITADQTSTTSGTITFS